MGKTGLVYHSAYLEHDMGAGHPESPHRLKAIMQQLERSGTAARLARIEPRKAEEEWITQIHSPSYLAALNAHQPTNGRAILDPDTSMSPGSLHAAFLAAGGALAAVDAIMRGEVEHVFCAVRPPGHHAQSHQGLGMCIFGNVAIEAHHARRVHKLPRVAVIDYDAHHGNGVQEAFYSDPSVLTISLHQRTWFGIGGEISERGEGAGDGTSINIPMPSGSGDGGYVAAFERVVIPALYRFKPDLILVAAGYDIGAFDTVSTMMVSSEGFRTMNQMLVDAARDLCGGRIILEQEGGYNPWATPFYVLATLEALSGIRTGVEDPFLAFTVDSVDNKLLPHQAEVIEEVRAAFDL